VSLFVVEINKKPSLVINPSLLLFRKSPSKQPSIIILQPLTSPDLQIKTVPFQAPIQFPTTTQPPARSQK